jgi:uncharacterized repeat protein (TIGR03803 family)
MRRDTVFISRLMAFLAAAFASAAPALAGYTLTTLASFGGSNGAVPLGNLTISGTTLYGTTQNGGANGYGEVFSLPIGGGTPTVLASFNNANGAYPAAGLTLSGTTLYGTTVGNVNGGNVFSLPIGGGTPTVLGSFTGPPNGDGPESVLTLSGSTLYGTTSFGDANGCGAVFSLPISGGKPTVLASFNAANGLNPSGLTLVGTTLYSTTFNGAANSNGEVFSLPITGGSPTVLATFGDATFGNNPGAGLTLAGSTFYGTTYRGGATNAGVIYSLPIGGGTPTVLASLDFASSGAHSLAGLTIDGSTLFGTTQDGGANGDGAVFSVPMGGGTPTVLATFNGTNGAKPVASLTLSGTTLYGTTQLGGANGDGEVFALIANPVVALTASAPTTFGGSLGSQTITKSSGNSVPVSMSFAPTANGYLAISMSNPSTDTQVYALNITDSIPANLNADLALLATQIDDGAYTGFTATADTTDPTGGQLTSLAPGNFNFFITLTGPTLSASEDYFGFDFSQLNATSDTLTTSGIAVTTVPEPASLSLLAVSCGALVLRRRRASC